MTFKKRQSSENPDLPFSNTIGAQLTGGFVVILMSDHGFIGTVFCKYKKG
jgi:hypothetical protein